MFHLHLFGVIVFDGRSSWRTVERREHELHRSLTTFDDLLDEME